MGCARIEARLCAGALLALAAGVGVYLLARGQHPLLPVIAQWSGPVPTLLHTVGFVLLCLAVVAPWPKLAPAVCAGWLLLESASEALQIDAVAQSPILRSLADAAPVVRAYLSGSFDPLDVVAAAAGTLVAAAAFARLRTLPSGGSAT